MSELKKFMTRYEKIFTAFITSIWIMIGIVWAITYETPALVMIGTLIAIGYYVFSKYIRNLKIESYDSTYPIISPITFEVKSK